MAKIALPDALSIVDDEATKAGVDPEVAKGIFIAENFGKKDVGMVVADPSQYSVDTERQSTKGARGLMQVMPATYDSLRSQGYLPSDHALTSDPRSQIQAGIAAIKEITKRIGSDDISAVAADYNAGPRGSKTFFAGGKLPAETDEYLGKVNLAATGFAANNPDFKGFSSQASQADVRAVDNSTPAPAGGVRPTKSTRTVADFESVQRMMQNNAIQIGNLINTITTDRTAEAAAYHEMSKSLADEALAQTEAGASQAVVESSVAQMKKRVTGILNIDTTQADNLIARNAAEYASLDEQKKSLGADIDSRMSVGLFDDPLRWLINQAVLPGKVNAYNAIVRRRNDLVHQSETFQNIAARQESIDVAASADDISKMYVSLGNAKAAEANAKAASARAQASSASARAAASIAGLVDTQTRLGMEMARMRTVIESEKTGGKSPQELQAEQDFEAGLKRIGTIIGSPDISLASLKRMTKPDQDEWAKRVAKSNVGDDLYEALTFMDKFGNTQNMTATGSAEMARYLQNMKSEVMNRARKIAAEQQTDLSGKALTREQLLQAAANDLDKEFFASRQNMAIARSYNPYLADHKSMATRFRGNENNIVYKTVRQATANNIKLSDQQLFTSVLMQLDAGKISPQQAAQDLGEYYSAVVDSNNKNRSMNLIGMDKQNDYMYLPKESPKTLDFTNPAQVENFFISRIANKATENLSYGGFAFTPAMDAANQHAVAVRKQNQRPTP